MIYELTIEHLVHRSQPPIFLHFENNPEASGMVRNLLGAEWSATQKYWQVDYEERVFEKVCDLFYKYQVRVFLKNE